MNGLQRNKASFLSHFRPIFSSNFSLIGGLSSARLLQLMHKVIDLYASIKTIWKETRKLSGRTIQTTWLQSGPIPTFRLDAEDIGVELLPVLRGLQWNRSATGDLERVTHSASVHAEAALLACTSKVDSSVNALLSPGLAVSDTCCAVCHLFHSLMGRKLDGPFVPSYFSTWIPPAGLPEDVLWKLRDILIDILYSKPL